MKSNNRSLHVFLAVNLILESFALWLGVSCVRAQSVPGLVNFQGRLTDSSNNPLTGVHGFFFEIYDDASAGALLWSETQPAVSVTSGVLSVQLGAVAPLAASVFSGNARYLQITVDNVLLSPRERLIAAPYAFNAQAIEGRGYQAFVSTDAAAQNIAGAKTFIGTVTLPVPTILTGAASDPSAATGSLYFNSTTNKLRLYVGDEGWVELSTGAPSGGASASGAAGYIAKFTSANMLENSNIADNGASGGVVVLAASTVTVQGNAFSVGGSTLVVASGNIGIGTPSPLHTMDVAGGYYSRIVVKGSASDSISIDWSKGNVQHVTLAGAVTLTFANGQGGGRYVLILKQDGTGDRTVTWPGTVRWSGGLAPTLSFVPGRTDYISFIYNSVDNTYDAVSFNYDY